MLAITTDGHKLPSFVIFRKTLLKDKFPPGIIVKSSRKRVDDCGAHPQVVECSVEKAAGRFIM
jgi:hypothetical protein